MCIYNLYTQVYLDSKVQDRTSILVNVITPDEDTKDVVKKLSGSWSSKTKVSNIQGKRPTLKTETMCLIIDFEF